jgi:hypothetical protein
LAETGASNQRIQTQAATLGLIVPEPGSITYVSRKPDDAATAAKRLTSGKLTGSDSAIAP